MVEWFARAWEDGYHTPAGKALEGLSAEQAFWRPSPDRHSIWQQVMHMAYWREFFLKELQGPVAFPSREELQEHNWPAHPQVADDQAWQSARRRLATSQEQLVAALRALPEERLASPLGPDGGQTVAQAIVEYMRHDSYHLGQIMLLRALQGLQPIF